MLNNIVAKKIIKWDIYNFKVTSLLYVYIHYWILRKDKANDRGKKTVICHRKVFLLVIFTTYYAQMCFNPVVNILYLISSCF